MPKPSACQENARLTAVGAGAIKVTIGNGASRCLDCHNRWGREYYQRSVVRREKMRRSYILRNYGISIEQLEEILHRQGGRCAICRRPWQECVLAKRSRYELRFLHHLCVDHDHATGNVAACCNACNTAIGLLEEDRLRFLAAAEYLVKYS